MKIKNVKDDIESLKNFTRVDFIKYIIQYNPEYFKQKEDSKYMLETFQRDFIGIPEYNDVER